MKEGLKRNKNMIARKLIIIVFMAAITQPAYAAWDAQCLNDCFSTGHECRYCAYQCERDPKTPPPYSKEIETCPLVDFQKVY